MLPELLHAGALRFYCRAAGLDPEVMLAWVRGEKVITWELAKLLEVDLGIPAEAWPRISGRPRGKPRKIARALVAYKHDVLQRKREPPPKETMTPEEAERRREWGQKWGRGYRKLHDTRVHTILDEMGWTMASLHRKLIAYLAEHDPQHRTISRATMQFYCAGERAFQNKRTRGRCAATAPIYIRRAVEVVTEGRLKPSDWPNTEDEDA
jgi:hypothetical protein